MEKNIIDIMRLGKWYGIYFSNKKAILSIVCVTCITIGIYIIKGLDKRKSLKIIGQNIIYIFMLITLGMVLQFSGVSLSFTIDYMPIFILSLAIIIIVFSYGMEILIYKFSRQERLAKATGTLRIIIFLEVLLLTVMNRLDMMETITALCSVCFFSILNIFIVESIDLKRSLVDVALDETVCDKPIDEEKDLFARRKAQLNHFKQILSGISDEPFAVMVTGAWGSGKTSFINAFCKTMDKAEFVWVEAGFNSQTREMLNDIADQIYKIFKANGIVSGGNKYISAYFGKAADMIEGVGHEFIAKILHDTFEEKKMGYNESKEFLNDKLTEFYHITQKRIFIIVDNLDRLTSNERESVFTVIRECVSLKNCVTIFLIDYKAFKTDHLNDDFLEKYVNYHVALTPMTYDELLSEYCNKIFPDKFWNEKSKGLTDKKSDIERYIINGPFEIVEKLKSGIESTKEELSKKEMSGDLKAVRTNRIDILTKAVFRLQERMQNPRKLIRFLRDMEYIITIVDDSWFSNSNYQKNEYSSYDWLRSIFEISFLKSYLPEEYDALSSAGDIWSFKKSDKFYCTSFVLSGLDGFLGDSKKEELLQLLIYRVYALNLMYDKSRHQKLIEDIESEQLDEVYLMEYINEGLGFYTNSKSYKTVINFIKENEFINKRLKVEGIIKIIEMLSADPALRNPQFKEIFKILKQIVDDMNQKKLLLETDKRAINRHLKHLETQAIFGRISNLKNILSILFQNIDSIFSDNCDNLDTFYTGIVKIMEQNSIEEIEVSNSKIAKIKRFIAYVKQKFEDKEYAVMRDIAYEILDETELALDMLQSWNIENGGILTGSIYINFEEGKLVGDYCESMDTWLMVIKQIYSLIECNSMDVCISYIITELIRETESRVLEDNLAFKDRGMEVYQQLEKLYFDVNKKIPQAYEQWGSFWRWNTVRLYNINKHVSSK
ncbi:P-loop NTPase fold protein [Enterocloster asparagiformis]|uniref:P-loop NTPase fold protein n=1 Tax=Enterocloster asparagiformis TaxID=333367 RepID=UPI002A840B5D|nr:P-loop NTPase fold protein [Enterocloster asparagiformis]